MNSQSSPARTIAIFVGLAFAGIAVAISAQIVPSAFAQTLMVALGSTIFGSGLTFFLIRMS